jgi:hypothetical protein
MHKSSFGGLSGSQSANLLLYLAYFPYFEKIKGAYDISLLSVCVSPPLIVVRRLLRSYCCLHVCVSLLILSFSMWSV